MKAKLGITLEVTDQAEPVPMNYARIAVQLLQADEALEVASDDLATSAGIIKRLLRYIPTDSQTYTAAQEYVDELAEQYGWADNA